MLLCHITQPWAASIIGVMGLGQSQDGFFFHCLPVATHAKKEIARTGAPQGTARLRLCAISVGKRVTALLPLHKAHKG